MDIRKRNHSEEGLPQFPAIAARASAAILKYRLHLSPAGPENFCLLSSLADKSAEIPKFVAVGRMAWRKGCPFGCGAKASSAKV
jgi:hypothetical protein